MKRLFDLIFAITLLIVCAPFFIIACLCIKFSSPGPLLFVAQRAGRNGQPFSMYKFRTMEVNSSNRATITGPKDARIFPVGNVLRRFKIDELPQLFNILKGDMSVVGPRPEDINIVQDHYEDWMLESLDVRPGLTSPGTLLYMRELDSSLDSNDPVGSYLKNALALKIEEDIKYVRNISIMNDIKIIIDTLRAVTKA